MNKFSQKEYDGSFFLEGKKVYYGIVYDDQRPICKQDGTFKISCFFNFFDENSKPLGCISVYDIEEQLHNITPDYAMEKYLKYVAEK